ncbi:hypothetical protein BC792_12856 [Sphingobacterium allocomposti]|uniref:Uncharacterized protein n=1 Tax=Sphingobacterium allocomposti TaxID=415956 RepID=A0A5S5CZY1_9SPHI|nr:hypothetical protein [Sphingobacterium composti Yoo et al. 2007 non Ten et al. 2007]TYP89337.1 hypothetical protein BC792_12856 [Sphingobacterium composti Yoo et al. 2007 non Ten et al. 2007]
MFSIGLLLMYLIWAGFIAIVLYGLYRVLSALLDRYLDARRDHTAALREQNETLKQIASALTKRDGTPNNDYQ